MSTAGDFTVGLAGDDSDLERIVDLQRRNLAKNLSAGQASADGFVTVEHTMDVLRRMHAMAPSIVARHGENLAGYALVAPLECRSFIPMLEPMFDRLSKLRRGGRPLLEHRTYFMGQVCVDAPFRGRGVFDLLYGEHKRQFSSTFDFVVTEVAIQNARSMRAHERIGFETIDRYRHGTNEWAIVLWDFGRSAGPAPRR